MSMTEVYRCDLCGKESPYGMFGVTRVTVYKSEGTIVKDLCEKCLASILAILYVMPNEETPCPK